MMSLIFLAVYLVFAALFLLALYWVVNRAVLHALRTHHQEVRPGAQPPGAVFPHV